MPGTERVIALLQLAVKGLILFCFCVIFVSEKTVENSATKTKSLVFFIFHSPLFLLLVESA
jgi:hypothetical protein